MFDFISKKLGSHIGRELCKVSEYKAENRSSCAIYDKGVADGVRFCRKIAGYAKSETICGVGKEVLVMFL